MNEVRIELRGPAGAGKTTLLHEIAGYLMVRGYNVRAVEIEDSERGLAERAVPVKAQMREGNHHDHRPIKLVEVPAQLEVPGQVLYPWVERMKALADEIAAGRYSGEVEFGEMLNEQGKREAVVCLPAEDLPIRALASSGVMLGRLLRQGDGRRRWLTALSLKGLKAVGVVVQQAEAARDV